MTHTVSDTIIPFMTVLPLFEAGSAELFVGEYKTALASAEAGDELARKRCAKILEKAAVDFVDHARAYLAHALVEAATAHIVIDFQGEVAVGEGLYVDISAS